jgi:hypothetical protein
MRGTCLIIFVQTFQITNLDELSYLLWSESYTVIEIADPNHAVCRKELAASIEKFGSFSP